MEYAVLAGLYQKLENTPKRLEKTWLMAEFLKTVSDDELEECTLLLQARAFPSWEKQTLGIAKKVMLKTLAQSLGMSERRLEDLWKETGDLGLVAEQYGEKHKQYVLVRQTLTTHKVFTTIKRLASIEGTGSMDTKQKYLQELLSQASPLEAKYLVRTALEDLRVGVAEGTLRDAIVWASFPSIAPKSPEEEPESRDEYKRIVQLVQDAYNRMNDFARLAATARKGESALRSVKLVIGTPVKVMLASREPTIEIAFQRTGTPAELEYKYDGFRVNIHKRGNEVMIFTRRLENVTEAFPDLVALVRDAITRDGIFDGETIGIDPDTCRYRPFQEISQRIRRKYDIEELAQKLPVETVLFDVLAIDDRDVLSLPFAERKAILEGLFAERPGKLMRATSLVTDDVVAGKAFFAKAKAAGCEGLVIKRLDSPYRPGARVGDWVKLKDVMENLDLVILGAEWGEGKRSGWLTSFELACRDDDGEFKTIGRVGTGLKELPEEGLSFGELTELLRPHIELEQGRSVTIHPAIVVEVAYQEIQKSPSYTSGYALRFPRIVRNRTDERDPDDASPLSYVDQLYAQQ